MEKISDIIYLRLKFVQAAEKFIENFSILLLMALPMSDSGRTVLWKFGSMYVSIQPNICHTREISLCELFYVYIHIIRAKYFGCSVVVISFRYFLLLNQNKLHLLIVVAQTCSYYCICVRAYVGDIRHITASGCSFTTSLIYGHCQWCNSATSDRCIYGILEQQHRPHHTTTNGFTQNFKECSAHTSKHTHTHIHLYLRPYTPQAENR